MQDWSQKTPIFWAAKRLFSKLQAYRIDQQAVFSRESKIGLFCVKNGFVGLETSISLEFFGLFGWTSRHAWLTDLGGSILGHLPDGPIYAQKTAFLESRRQLSSVFLDFFHFGRSHVKPELVKTGSGPQSGRRGNTPCHRIDRLFKPNWPPDSPPDQTRPPRPDPQEFWK